MTKRRTTRVDEASELQTLQSKFRRLDEKHGRYYMNYCTKCEEYAEENGEVVEKVIGRLTSFKAHLKKCPHHQHVQLINTASTSSSRSCESSVTSTTWRTQRLTNYLQQGFTREQVLQYENLLCEFIADNGVSFHVVEKHSTRRLLNFLRPTGLENLPSRKKLSGTILNRVADSSRAVHVEQLKIHCEDGRVVTLMLDGWENKSRKHIIGVILQSGEVWIVYEENGNYDSSDEHHGIAIKSVIH